METIKIDSVENKTSKNNKPYFLIGYNGSEKTSTFDATMGGYLMSKIGDTVNVEFEMNGNFKNLSSIDYTAASPELPNIPIVPKQSGSLLSARDNIIVAQVILKEANNNLCAIIASGVELEEGKYGQFLCDNVKELTGAYKLALELMNE